MCVIRGLECLVEVFSCGGGNFDFKSCDVEIRVVAYFI